MTNYEGATEVPVSTANGNEGAPLDFGQELQALAAILKALSPLTADARKFVLRTASDRLGISSAVDTPKERPASVSSSNSAPQSGGLEGTSPKDFLRIKKPTTESQRMVCLAFYLTHAVGKPHFKTQDLTALNTEAAGGKFSNPSMTVRNATTQSHFLAPGRKAPSRLQPSERNTWKPYPTKTRPKLLYSHTRREARGDVV